MSHAPPGLAFDPLAQIFPLMEGDEFAALLADVQQHGVREPIWLYNGNVLDGRNRYRAAQAAKTSCPSRVYRGNDPLSFVISLNLKRRHLNESQRSIVAARLANMPQGARTDKPSANLPNVVSQDQAAKLLNVSERSLRSAKVVLEQASPALLAAVEQGHIVASLAAQASKLSKEQQTDVADRASRGEVNAVRKVVKQSARAAHEKDLAGKQMALPDKKYGVILADPEWRFETWSAAELVNSSPDNHYSTSSLDDIKNRDVAKISAADCALFLWSTVPMLPQALDVLEAWGFRYVTNFAWIKNRAGTGYWNRNKHETLLLGTKGSVPAPAPGMQWESIIEAPVARHSQKPDQFLQLIESYFPNLPKIELNRRGPARPGWDAWGVEAENVT